MKQWIGYHAGSVALLTLSALVTLSVPQTLYAQDHPQPKVTAPSPSTKQASPAVEGINIFGHYQTRFINGNIDSDLVYTIYLLLKDGTYYEGIPPVALEEWDIAASRAAEPKEWGRWHRTAKGRIVMRPGDASQKEFTNNGLHATPAKPGERLNGVSSSTYSNTSSAGGRSSNFAVFRELHFFPDGRFQKEAGSSFSDSRTDKSGVFTSSLSERTLRHSLSD